MSKSTKLGKIVHYYGQIGVGVVKVLATIKVGDKIRIVGGDREFDQEVKSMQMEHENIQEAKKGDDIGLKFDQPVKKGDEVYKAE